MDFGGTFHGPVDLDAVVEGYGRGAGYRVEDVEGPRERDGARGGDGVGGEDVGVCWSGGVWGGLNGLGGLRAWGGFGCGIRCACVY